MFVNNWGDDTKKILERFCYYTPNHDNYWNNIQAVEDINDAEYLIVMDGLPKTCFNFPNKIKKHPRKIFLQREPPEMKNKKVKLENLLFDGSYENHYHVCTWMVKIPFKKLEQLQKPTDLKPLSAVISNKAKTYGQKQRIQTIKHVAKLYNKIDVFGKNLKDLELGANYKGVLDYNDFCKFEGLYGYKYSLAFENSSHRNYFTEKLIDCFLCWTKPIYWGCSNIGKYFPKESYSYIDIFDKNAAKIIIKEILKPVNYDAIQEARELVLYKYNIWPSLETIINSIKDKNSTNI